MRFGILPYILLAIVLGLGLGGVASPFIVQIFATWNSFFGQYLGFCIPLIVLGLVTHGIADLGKRGGRLLLVTVTLAYLSTICAGLFAYSSCQWVLPGFLNPSANAVGNVIHTETVLAADLPVTDLQLLDPLFSLVIPPLCDVLTALLLAFVLGIGMTRLSGMSTTGMTEDNVLKGVFAEFRTIVVKLIAYTVVPLLPLHIFGLFLNMSHSGAAFAIIQKFGCVIAVIFALHLIYLLFQFLVAALIGKKNPFKMLWTMLPAYATALGTSSSAATIPVTLRQTKKLGVNEDIADFCIPLCATIHLSGSTIKIVATALTICLLDGLPHHASLFLGFILLLGVMMVAAPGVPGGAIMVAIGALQSVLGFNESQIAMMVAIYLAIDSFGTAGNVTGDGAISVIIDSQCPRE